MSSINDLPEEILVHIFSYYAKSEGICRLLENLMSVCVAWKEAASAPILWQNVEDFHLEGHRLLELSRKGIFSLTKSLNLAPQAMYFIGKQPELVEVLGHCRNLLSLNLSYHQISRELFRTILVNCTKIESITLQHARSSSEEYWCLAMLKPLILVRGENLKYLNLNHCKLICDDDTMEAIAETCRSLEEFHFYYSYNFCFKGAMNYILPRVQFPVGKFQKGCPRLRVLKLGRCTIIPDNDHGAPGFPHLVNFGAHGSRFVRDSLMLMLYNSKELEKLELYDCDHNQVFRKNLLQIPSQKVSVLLLGKMDKFSPTFLDLVVGRWKHVLKELELSTFDFNVSPVLLSLTADVTELGLECLDLFDSDVDLPVLQAFVRKCPKLSVVELSSISKTLPFYIPRSFSSREDVERILQY